MHCCVFRKRHEVFGDVKRLLTSEFVRQEYLDYSRQPDTDPPIFEFRWGVRAKIETTKADVLKMVCSIYGETDTSSWKTQFADIRHDQQQEGTRDADVTVVSTQPKQNAAGPSQRATRSSRK